MIYLIINATAPFDAENKVLKTPQDNQQNLKKCIIKI